MECLLGVVELVYQTGPDTFTIDADQLKALEAKCRPTSKAASSKREAAARPWEPTGWAARKEPLRSECVQRHLTLLTEAGGDWRNPLPQADGSSLVLRMHVVDECNAVPFSGQLVTWAAALGFNVVDNSRGGRQICGTECGIIAAFKCVALAKAGDAWCTLRVASLGVSAFQPQLK